MENYIKKGEKGLKNASFWAINSKKFISLKKFLLSPGVGEMETIFPCLIIDGLLLLLPEQNLPAVRAEDAVRLLLQAFHRLHSFTKKSYYYKDTIRIL